MGWIKLLYVKDWKMKKQLNQKNLEKPKQIIYYSFCFFSFNNSLIDKKKNYIYLMLLMIVLYLKDGVIFNFMVIIP